MAQETNPTSSRETRERLLEAAGETFGAVGFRRATVRDICARAEANIAAVNYHFRDKQGLYEAVLQHWFGEAVRKHPPDAGLPADAPAEQRLYGFVRSFLARLVVQGASACHERILTQELLEPTSAIDVIVNETIRPMFERLQGIVRALIGPGATDAHVRFSAASIAGQCVFYLQGQAVLSRLHPELKLEAARIDLIAEHITRFSLRGLLGYATSPNAGATEPRA